MTGRRTSWIITGVCFAAFVAGVIPLAQRVRAFNQTAHFARLHAEVKSTREFKLAGFPVVRLTDSFDDAGRAALRLEFGQTSRLIPVQAPRVRNMPNLAAYEEWTKVLAINEVELDQAGRSVAKPGSERLLIVVRRTPDGFDPETWGSVRRSEWAFDIYDLKADESISKQTFRWPRSDKSEERLKARNSGESARPHEVALAALPRLPERSVEMLAAMHVIPKLNVPEHKFNDTAFSPKILGWTLPMAMLGMLGTGVGIAFTISAKGGDRQGKAESSSVKKT